MRMNAKSFLFIFVVGFLSLAGMVQAQQDRGQGDIAGGGRSPSEYNSYMGGKEHYLADSPNYMAGKKHYLQGGPFPNSGGIGQGNDSTSPSKEKTEAGERKKTDEQRETQIQIQINVIPEDATKGYGIIYLPVIHPKHHGGKGSSSPHVDPNPPQTGSPNLGASSGFQQGVINFR